MNFFYILIVLVPGPFSVPGFYDLGACEAAKERLQAQCVTGVPVRAYCQPNWKP